MITHGLMVRGVVLLFERFPDSGCVVVKPASLVPHITSPAT